MIKQDTQIGQFFLRHIRDEEEGKNFFSLRPLNGGYVPQGLLMTVRDPYTGDEVTSSECNGEDIIALRTKGISVPYKVQIIIEVLGQELHFYID